MKDDDSKLEDFLKMHSPSVPLPTSDEKNKIMSSLVTEKRSPVIRWLPGLALAASLLMVLLIERSPQENFRSEQDNATLQLRASATPDIAHLSMDRYDVFDPYQMDAFEELPENYNSLYQE